MRHKAPIDQRRLVTISFLVESSRRGVPNHGHFEPLFDEIPQMRFDTQVADRAGQNERSGVPDTYPFAL